MDPEVETTCIDCALPGDAGLVVRPLSELPRDMLLTHLRSLEQFIKLAELVFDGKKLADASREVRKAEHKKTHRSDRPGYALANQLKPLLEQVFGCAPDLWVRDGRESVVWVSEHGIELMRMAKPFLREQREQVQALCG